MTPRYTQVNCREENKVDLRQARAVLRLKPDIILFEYPSDANVPSWPINKFKPGSKPLKAIRNLQKKLRDISRVDPWVASDIKTLENVVRLWENGRQVFLYSVDAPSELVRYSDALHRNMYRRGPRGWIWWARIYLRERYMARNIRWVLNNYDLTDHPKILVFLQSFHWKHVKFLLTKPSKEKMWRYYFGQYSQVTPLTIGKTIRQENRILYRYWRKDSDFTGPHLPQRRKH